MVVRSLAAGAAGAVGAFVLSMGAPSAAQAATFLGGCGTTDISPAAGACNGYYQGNVNGNSPDMQADQTTALTALGLTGPFTQVEHLEISSGDQIDFNTLLNGATFISVHWGAGQGPMDVPGGVTGFYRLDLASDAELDAIVSNFGSLSNAVLWSTTECSGAGCGEGPGGGVIPEPATWAMMILGFGGTGALIRRRRKYAAFA